MLKRLVVHFSIYSAGNLLIALASLVSFPMFTRLFSPGDYGILSLVSATLTFLTSVGKAGSQHSIVRFYSEVKAGTRPTGLTGYYSTVLFGMALTGGAATIVWALLSQLIPDSVWHDSRLRGLFLLTASIIFVRVIESGVCNLLRAQERSAPLVFYVVAKKYVGLAMILATVVFLWRSPSGFFGATLASEAIAVGCLVFLAWRSLSPRLSAFDTSLFREILAFGIPMLGYEIAGITLSIGDRYVVQNKMGSAALGVYSATYNFCDYVQAILIASVGTAIQPIYNRLWEEKGREATEAFLEKALYYYVLMSAPVVAGLAAVGPELLPLLASSKYLAGVGIIPYVMLGMAMDGATTIFNSGLYIHKRTKTVLGLISLCAAANLGLNLLLVPHLGLVGAGVATLLAYWLLLLLGGVFSRPLLRVRVPWVGLLKASGASLVMYWGVQGLSVGSGVVRLSCKIGGGVLIYAAVALLLDQTAREALRLGMLEAKKRLG